MIVSDHNVETSLRYLAEDPHPVALARKDTTDAENARKEAYALAFIKASGAVDTRKAIAEIDPDYIAAKHEESEAVFELERHRSRVRAAEMLVSVWQSENANARAAERVR